MVWAFTQWLQPSNVDANFNVHESRCLKIMFWGLPKRFGNISIAQLWFASVVVRPCMALAAWPSNKECKWLNLSIKLKCWFTWIALLKLSPKFCHCVTSPQNFGNASLGSFALGWLDIKLAFVLKLVNDWEVVSKTKHSKTKTEARSTQISKTNHLNLGNEAPIENEAPKSRKSSTQKTRKRRNLKLEISLSFINTRQPLANTAGIITITNRMQFKSTQVEPRGVVNAFPPLSGRLCFGRDQKTENAQTISRMLRYRQEKPIRRQSPTHNRPLSSPLSSMA